ncbi:DTW domain-containing protein [Thiomicrorhabdus sp. zzn3]|uniref:tRNA-uridine aminocarboxypropyltransferase n=1 Tax=Thiomicrorhabdus sp. zzn3 TaxID=3039775 RepID=UPI0024368BA3|nr:DTW domain-containing protein [Thiomicrorhabdus sp. zzn3]MDG6778568.1 DTW domain-containing protein [Thiomicrorhabdus sp. zzn3]
MSRKVCERCGRPEKVCLCPFITPLENRVEIGILQHPSEVKQIKGTAIIATLSLSHCRLWEGERFSDVGDFHDWLQQGTVYLLYPELGDHAASKPVETRSLVELKQALRCAGEEGPLVKILLLDGTWRKTHKMMMLNPELQSLPRLTLHPQRTSAYRIRKQKNDQSLSTIEAIYEVLSGLEENQSFEPLLEAFEQMNQQQLAFRPVH